MRPDRRLRASYSPEVRRRQRITLAAIGVLLVLVLGILVAGYVIIFVLPPRQLVVRVDDVKYSRGDMVKLLRARQKQLESTGGRLNVGTDIFQALQLIRENEIIAQVAPRFGITVPSQEIDAQIEAQFAPPANGATDPRQIEREFRERYSSFLNDVQLSDGEYRQLVRKSILREKFRQFIGDSVPTVAEQVHVYRLVMSPEDEIDIMRVKFKDAVGDPKDPTHLQEAFKQIVREFSRDTPEMVRRGGDLGWVPRGVIRDYEYRFFDLEVGELSLEAQDMDTPRQLLFFMVSERSDAREIDERSLDILKTNALQDWINDEVKNHDTFVVFNSEIYDWMIKQLGLTTTRTPEPQPTGPLGF